MKGQRYADTNGHLDEEAVVAAMVIALPDLKATLEEDADISANLPCLQISLIAKALVDHAVSQPDAVRRVLDVAEAVLTSWDQEGRDFIAACMLEGVPKGGETVLVHFAGPLVAEWMAMYL